MHPRQIAGDNPARLNLIAWHDPLVDQHGHWPGAAYVEEVWLSLLGPAALCAWQRLGRMVAATPATTMDLVDLAASLGLGQGLGRTAPISHTLATSGRIWRGTPGRRHSGRTAGLARPP